MAHCDDTTLSPVSRSWCGEGGGGGMGGGEGDYLGKRSKFSKQSVKDNAYTCIHMCIPKHRTRDNSAIGEQSKLREKQNNKNKKQQQQQQQKKKKKKRVKRKQTNSQKQIGLAK